MNTKDLVLLIAANAGMTEEQFVQCKQVAVNAMQKLLTGEAQTEDEVKICAYVTKQMQRIAKEGNEQAERAAKLAEAKAVYERELQQYHTEFEKGFKQWVKDATKLNVNSHNAAKELFATFLASQPAEPKDPTLVKTTSNANRAKRNGAINDGTTKAWNKQVDPKNLRDGSTLKTIWDFVCQNPDGVTRKEMTEEMFAKHTARKTADNKFSVYEAISGRLPLLKQTGKRTIDGKETEVDVWIANLQQTEPELEVVTPTTEEQASN